MKRPWRLTSLGVAAAIIGISLAATLARGAGASAGSAELYRAQTIVTGQAEPNRGIGFAACLEDVLIKVSGALQLVGNARLAAYKSRASDFVSAFHYHDQMSGTPTRDEQGTRDRPYDLIVDFDATKIDDLLKSLGLKPWLSQRPVLAVFVEMEQGTRKYIVTADAKQSDLQRDSLLAAAAKRGVSIVLPDVAALTTSKIDRGADGDTIDDLGARRGRAGRASLLGRTAGVGRCRARMGHGMADGLAEPPAPMAGTRDHVRRSLPAGRRRRGSNLVPQWRALRAGRRL